MEKNLLSIGLKNLIKINTVLDEKFFKDCNMFADTLHLSIQGVSLIKESTNLTDGK